MRNPIPILVVLCAIVLLGCGQAAVETRNEPAPPETAAETSESAWTELVPNARQPLEGVVSGGQPTAAQLAQAAAAGFKTVVNLRTPGERGTDDEAAQVAGLGMEYVSLPIDGANDVTEGKARELAQLLESSQKPILLHCGSGNRVGALLALSAYYVDGQDPESALQYGLDSGLTGLEPVVRERLAGGE